MASRMKFNKKIVKSNPGRNVEKAMTQINERNNALKCNEDTIIRTEIHGIIISGVNEGKSKDEIMNKLFENSRYDKYSSYFEIWIDTRINKKANKERER